MQWRNWTGNLETTVYLYVLTLLVRMYVRTYVSTYVNTWAYTYHAQKVGFGLVRWLLSGSLNPNHLVPTHVYCHMKRLFTQSTTPSTIELHTCVSTINLTSVYTCTHLARGDTSAVNRPTVPSHIEWGKTCLPYSGKILRKKIMQCC